MKNLLKYAVAYAAWVADLVLAFWLMIISRTAFLGVLAQFYDGRNVAFQNAAGFADKAFLIILGLGWLAFSIFSETYFRTGAQQDVLLQRITQISGIIFLSIFCVDMLIFWLQGSSDWLRWLILAAELGFGIFLTVSANRKTTSQPT